MTYKAAQQQECLTAGLQLQLVQQCSLAGHGPAAMWHSYMPIHMIADDVIIIVHVAGCGWGRRGGAEQAADGSVCIVQVHEGYIVISTQAPHMQGLHLGSKQTSHLQNHVSLQTFQLANAGGAGSYCPHVLYVDMHVREEHTLVGHAATVYCVAANRVMGRWLPIVTVFS